MNMKIKKVKKVMIFGVFDLLHLGHISFLEQAVRYGNELIVVVARDSSVQELKHKMPSHSEKERVRAIKKNPLVNRAVLGDSKLGRYGVIKKHKPDLICLGYDQKPLEKDLKQRMQEGKIPMICLILLRAHKPEEFHTSFLTR